MSKVQTTTTTTMMVWIVHGVTTTGWNVVDSSGRWGRIEEGAAVHRPYRCLSLSFVLYNRNKKKERDIHSVHGSYWLTACLPVSVSASSSIPCPLVCAYWKREREKKRKRRKIRRRRIDGMITQTAGSYLSFPPIPSLSLSQDDAMLNEPITETQ